MKLHNTLTKKVEDFKADDKVGMYSCGPTVYDHAHIGNLSAFITADILRRILILNELEVHHVMNFTDVDDKTIKRSKEMFPSDTPELALQKLTEKYEKIFKEDTDEMGNDTAALDFIRATDSISQMQSLILKLHNCGVAYIADDGVYLSLKKYRESGKKYGQLVNVSEESTSEERISNDEYDKDSAHDFALWKTKKEGEPSWDFEIDGKDMSGRPGWHIECSAMSHMGLGIPFDIHTGGIDLAFPHHENEIAQSTACEDGDVYARFFVHNEHLLVDGKKMSKSLGNFYTLQDIKGKGYNPLAFRLLVLQSHYRSQTNFSWKSLDAASSRLKHLQAFSALRFQIGEGETSSSISQAINDIKEALSDDLDTPKALEVIASVVNDFDNRKPSLEESLGLNNMLSLIDNALGLKLLSETDITEEQKQLIQEREQARTDKDWDKADGLRGQLKAHQIEINDSPSGPIWSKV